MARRLGDAGADIQGEIECWPGALIREEVRCPVVPPREAPAATRIGGLVAPSVDALGDALPGDYGETAKDCSHVPLRMERHLIPAERAKVMIRHLHQGVKIERHHRTT